MLTHEDNEYLCRVGKETPMGKMLRRFWTPVCLADDIPEPGGDPLPVRVLGEDLVVFRTGEGAVGAINERCTHRGASLRIGRVDDCGIRCLYHGWQFGVDGTIRETPNLRDSRVRNKIKAPAYPTREAGGLLWAYFGPPEKLPEFPVYNWMATGPQPRVPVRMLVECNWVQLIEGTIDSSHVGILHSDELEEAQSGVYDTLQHASDKFPTSDDAPELVVENTDFGFHYAAIRALRDDDGADYVRVTPYVLPYMNYTPPGRAAILHVPVDDGVTAQYGIGRWPDGAPSAESARFFGIERPGVGTWRSDGVIELPPQDRQAMREGRSLTGYRGLVLQDLAVTLTQGVLYDREQEHLVPSDIAAIRMRRLLIESARRVEQGLDPIGLDTAVDTMSIQGAAGPLKKGEPWQSLVPGNRRRDSAPRS
jgi:phthalate 4,5-dioxygenase